MLTSLRSSRGFVSLSALAVVASVAVVGIVGSGMSTSLLEALPFFWRGNVLAEKADACADKPA